MNVLVAATRSMCVPYLCGKYDNTVGMMYSPDAKNDTLRPWPWMPWAIDNGMYQSIVQEKDWDERTFFKLIELAHKYECPPEFIVVPDEPFDANRTRSKWDKWAPRLEDTGFTLAFSAQPGIVPSEIPAGVVAFIGGTNEFKLKETSGFVDACQYVHVGRVNRYRHLVAFDKLGVKSVDGSGYLRGGYGTEAYTQLTRYLGWVAGGRVELQTTLFDSCEKDSI